MELDTLIKQVIQRRRAMGLTQKQLAEIAGVSRRTIIALENGEGDIGMRRFARILRAMGMGLSLGAATTRPTESELRHRFQDDDE